MNTLCPDRLKCRKVLIRIKRYVLVYYLYIYFKDIFGVDVYKLSKIVITYHGIYLVFTTKFH